MASACLTEEVKASLEWTAHIENMTALTAIYDDVRSLLKKLTIVTYIVVGVSIVTRAKRAGTVINLFVLSPLALAEFVFLIFPELCGLALSYRIALVFIALGAFGLAEYIMPPPPSAPETGANQPRYFHYTL